MLATLIKRKGYSYLRVALSQGIKELAIRTSNYILSLLKIIK
jgi:hypothetical protein